MYCSKCGTELRTEANYCYQCGTPTKEKPDSGKFVKKAFKTVIGKPTIALLKLLGRFIKKHYFGFVLTIELLILLFLYILLTKTAIGTYGDGAYLLIAIPVILLSCGFFVFVAVTATPESSEKAKERWQAMRVWLNKDNENKMMVLFPVGIACLAAGVFVLVVLQH